MISSPVKLKIFSVLPRPCMYGCTCYYSLFNRANVFDCDRKNLTLLPKDVLYQTNWILASGNNLGDIHLVETYMENVTHLNISNSHVSHITDVAIKFILTNIKTFDLSSNALEILPRSIMETNNDTKLWISDNPYDCNCDMMWMRDWLVITTGVLDKENVICAKGKMIGSMHEFLKYF